MFSWEGLRCTHFKADWNGFKRLVRSDRMEWIRMLTSNGQNEFECLSRTGWNGKDVWVGSRMDRNV
jgi:hypothetical protein